MKFYVSTSVKNYKEAQAIINTLSVEGYSCTYDWTQKILSKESSEDDFYCISKLELKGIKNCDIFILLLPGGKGSHVEFGYALALKKFIILIFDYLSFYDCPFYIHANAFINYNINQLLKIIDSYMTNHE